MRRHAIKPTRIAPGTLLGVDKNGEWILQRGGTWGYCEHMDYALDFIALVLRNAEALAIAVSGRLYGVPFIERFDFVAIRKLIDRANELWTFKVEK